MFSKKQQSLIERKESTTSVATSNSFVQAGLKKAAVTTSLGNGAVKFETTGNDFVDQFGKITNYRQPRSYEDIARDMSTLWSKSPKMTIALTLFIRLITRVVSFFSGEKTTNVQRGQGLRHEGIVRAIWIAVNHPTVFWKNIELFISAGSWKDVIQMLSYDLQYNGWENRQLHWEEFKKVILAGLENPKTSNLVKKYLPTIKSNSKCNTLEAQADNVIAKWICANLFGEKKNPSATYKQYRQLKSSGTAHTWQQLISKKQLLEIDFNTVHGRALAQMVSSKFLTNNKLEAKYEEWISKKPIAKFTGYVYELLAPVKVGYVNTTLKRYQIDTINKQFEGLIQLAKQGMNDKSGLLVVLDTSSSMTAAVPGLKVSAYSVGKAMALYFSYLLKGPFANHFMQFADNAKLIAWKGSTPVEKIMNDRSEAYGGTNFQSVTRVFIDLKRKGVPESDFPSGILCISDGCFNNSRTNKAETRTMKDALKSAGFSKDYINNFKIVIWDIPNHYYSTPQTAFEEFADCPNLFYFSGLDGAAIAFLTGVNKQKEAPKTAAELFEAAMDQELMHRIEI